MTLHCLKKLPGGSILTGKLLEGMSDHSGRRSLDVLLCTAMLLAAGILSSVANASEIAYLQKSETFCDLTGEVCLRGTISYRVNLRLLKLRSRVVTVPGPGLLRINVTGENRQGHLHRASIEVTIRGHASEIVNKEMIPDAPDVYEWHLESILFDAKVPDSNEAR